MATSRGERDIRTFQFCNFSLSLFFSRCVPATRWGRQRDTTVSIYGLQVAKHESRDIIEHDSFYSSFMLCSLFQLCSFCIRGINRPFCGFVQTSRFLCTSSRLCYCTHFVTPKNFTPRSLQFNTDSFNTWNNLYPRLLTRDFRSRIKLFLNNICDKKETPRIQSRKRMEATYIFLQRLSNFIDR